VICEFNSDIYQPKNLLLCLPHTNKAEPETNIEHHYVSHRG